jgi:hypothetical protein
VTENLRKLARIAIEQAPSYTGSTEGFHEAVRDIVARRKKGGGK